MKTLEEVVVALECAIKVMEKQKEMNEMVIKTFNQVDQELDLLKVAVGEMKKEVRACRA